MKDPYSIIIKRRLTEKSKLMEELHNKSNNPSIARCKTPKCVFEVALDANKNDIRVAIEEIYKEQNVKVVKVNTVRLKGKLKRRGRGRIGATSKLKKAVVTLEEGNALAEKV